MFNTQSNKARFIYTLSVDKKPNSIRLTNKLYFSKEARSDEKLRFTESEITSILRTLCFTFTFTIIPQNSVIEIINSGDVVYTPISWSKLNETTDISINEFIRICDGVLGKGFTTIAQRPFQLVYKEYHTVWRFAFSCNQTIYTPSAYDFLLLRQFININSTEYSESEKFILI